MTKRVSHQTVSLQAPAFREPRVAIDASLKTHVPGLDELRGLSVIWVLICHSTGLTTWMPTAFASYGLHGVILFFLVSGYLITRILLESKERSDYFSRFYVNRLFRIWPLMLLALAVSVAVWPSHARGILYNLLLVNNYAYAMAMDLPVRTDVMWSLAIEQQFYLFWPVAVWLVSRQALLWMTSAIVLTGFGVDAGLLPAGGIKIIHATTQGAMQYVAMGSLMAFGREGLRYLLGAWGAFALWWFVQAGPDAIQEFRWIGFCLTVGVTMVVYQTIHRRPFITSRYLALAGERCYGLYLIHFFIAAFAFKTIGQDAWIAWTTYLVLSFLLAALSFRYFEQPVQRLRTYFHDDARLRVGLFASIGFMMFVNVAYLIIKSRL